MKEILLLIGIFFIVCSACIDIWLFVSEAKINKSEVVVTEQRDMDGKLISIKYRRFDKDNLWAGEQ